MNPTKGFPLWMVGGRFLLGLIVLSSSVLLRQTSATTTAQDGSDVTPSEVNDRTHYKTGGGIGQKLRIAAVEMDPFFSKELTPSGDSYSGYLVDVVEEISRIVPFQFEWVVVDKEETNGRRRKNGNSWAELTGKVSSGMANISVLPLDSSNQILARRFSYTQPFLKSTLSLLARAPETPSDPHRPWLLENFLNASDYSRPGFGVISEGVAHQLKTSNLSLYQQIWNDRSPSEVVVPLEEGLKKVRQGDFVLIMESTEAVYHSSREPCNLLAHDQFTHETGYVFATRRNGTLVGLLNDALDRLLREEGDFFTDLYRKWWDTDECRLGRVEEAESDDRDLDMERIFFTSPIKFFKTSRMVIPAQVTQESTRPVVTMQPIQPDVDDPEDPDRSPDVSAAVSDRPDTVEEFRHGRLDTIAEQTSRSTDVDWHRKRHRTTHPLPLPSTPGVPSFEARVQTDAEFNRRSQRRSRGPKQTLTTIPLRTQVPPRLDFEARTRESPNHGGRWPSEGRDTIQGSRHHQKGAINTAATPVHWRTTLKSSRDIVTDDFDWVFKTDLPRDEYEIGDYEDDDDVYREQRITVRVFEAKQKDPIIRVSNSKDTGGAKSEAKPNRKSSGKSSSSKIEFASLLTVILASVGLLLSR